MCLKSSRYRFWQLTILVIYGTTRISSSPEHLWQKYANSFLVRYRMCLELRVSLAGSNEGTRGNLRGGRRERGKFVTNSFVSRHPAKRATRKKTIPDCYPTVVSRGEPRRVAERRGKRAKRPFASAKPFLQPCMQPPRESQTWHTYTSGSACV